MAMYRCHNPQCSTDPHGRLIYDFEASEPVCPKCGADQRKKESRFLIVKILTMHYHVEDPKGPDTNGRGKRFRIACNGASVAGKRASAECRAVTCAACKRTPEWKKAAEAEEEGFETPEELDFEVEINQESATIERKGCCP